MADDNPIDDDGPYYGSGDSLQEFTDDCRPSGQPRTYLPLFKGESADGPAFDFTCFGDDDSGDSVPA